MKTRNLSVNLGLISFVALLAGTEQACSSPSCEETLTCAGPATDAAPGDSRPADNSVEQEASDSGANSDQLAPALPRIVSVTPANGAKGVAKDAQIVITFSAPMNQSATQAAYQSADLPGSQTVMTWDPSGSILTIKPNMPLAYAAGTDPLTLLAKRYAFRITTTATDLLGNKLAADVQDEFTTLRRLSKELEGRVDRLERNTVSICGTAAVTSSASVGDNETNTPDKFRSSFDLTTLPPGITIFETAKLYLEQVSSIGDPYGGLGPLKLEHVYFAPGDTNIWETPPLASLGNISTSWQAPVNAEVRDALMDDYLKRSQRNNQSQYRFCFTKATDSDGKMDVARFICWVPDYDAGGGDSTVKLSISYLLP
jgi:hypothetical protein